jgi:hypothetical protein
MSEYFKDMLALVIGTVLVMLVWLAIGAGRIGYRLSRKWVPEARGPSRSRRLGP